jgi:hypothetical protein
MIATQHPDRQTIKSTLDVNLPVRLQSPLLETEERRYILTAKQGLSTKAI